METTVGASSELRMLVAYSMASTFTKTTADYLRALKRRTGLRVEYVHVTHEAELAFDLSSYDVVFVSYCARLCFPGYVSEAFLSRLALFEGLKVLAVQDEYDNTDVLRAAIRRVGFHLVLTCVPQERLDYVYPRRDFPEVRFETVLTGYAPDEPDADAPPPIEGRRIELGYRGRSIGGRYGRLAAEKEIIGVRMKRICETHGVVADIAVDEESRIYGEAWPRFIESCRAMLGTESGSNVFDFDGSIARAFARADALSTDERAALDALVARRESEIDMGQVSPRVFECAERRTALVLFRGRYSGVLEPGAHYIPLEKDFSNADEVLERLRDLEGLEALTARAYAHLVASGRYGYAAFGARLRALIDELHEKLIAPARPVRTAEDGAGPAPSGGGEHATSWPGGAADLEIRRLYGRAKALEAEVDRLADLYGRTQERWGVRRGAPDEFPRAAFDASLARIRRAMLEACDGPEPGEKTARRTAEAAAASDAVDASYADIVKGAGDLLRSATPVRVRAARFFRRLSGQAFSRIAKR